MTWSVVQTMPGSTGAEKHTALIYLYDTYLGSRANWTVTNHPSPQAYKRTVQYTVPTNKFDGQPYTFYNWVSWGGTSPSYHAWYEDATYTTVPGDLGTDTTNNVQGDSVGNSGTFYFCESTEQPDAALVFKGTEIIFYMPHITEGIFIPDPNWDGTNDTYRTNIIPYIGQSNYSLKCMNAPLTTNTGSSEYNMIPDVGYGGSTNATVAGNTARIATKFNWMYTLSTTTPQMDAYGCFAFADGKGDTGVMLPAVQTATANRRPFNTTGTITYQIGTDYWIHASTTVTDQSLCFNFGAIDPGII